MIMPPPPSSSILTRTSFSLCSKAAMWDSKTSTLPLLPRMVISSPVRARWAEFGNGLARCWIGVRDSNQWSCIQVIQVCLPPHASNPPTTPSKAKAVCIGTADFFDGKHNIVLGGSWATHPRIAGRKTLWVNLYISMIKKSFLFYDEEARKDGMADRCVSSVNWYQRKYRFCWAGARLVRDDWTRPVRVLFWSMAPQRLPEGSWWLCIAKKEGVYNIRFPGMDFLVDILSHGRVCLFCLVFIYLKTQRSKNGHYCSSSPCFRGNPFEEDIYCHLA